MQKSELGFVRNSSAVEKKEMEGGAGIRWLITHREGAENFSMRLIEVPEGKNTPSHSHDYEHEIFVVEGKMEVTIGNKKLPASKNDFVFIPPNVHHSMNAKADLRIICIVPIKAAKEILGE